MTLVPIVILATAPAIAHEVGGRRGSGTIVWSPGVPEAGATIEIEINDLSLDSGQHPTNLRVEAWRAEHRIEIPVDDRANNGPTPLTLPEEGLWFMLVRADTNEESLLWGDHFTVAEPGAGESGSHKQSFTLGVDTLAAKEPPAWVDFIAYGLSLAVLGLLIVGVLRALRRIPPHGAPSSNLEEPWSSRTGGMHPLGR